jgi:hypothetical protein
MKLNEKANETAFDLFEHDYDLQLLTVKVQCPKCGHVWGIKVDDYNKSLDIPERKFDCEVCQIQK